MSTETLDRRASHVRGVTVTAIAALGGVAAALLSSAMATGAKDSWALLVLGAAIAIQLPVLRALGIDVEDFSPKDFLYVAFMTFAFWYIAWTILLTSATSVSF